ncbi:MAG TPA: hypothetical protein VFJ21_13925 [Mycobacteriales bacterium]|nr:hypothetical protein [Mycobacteriales bacterium]
MSVCHVYLKSGQVIDLHGKGFTTTYGRLDGDLREIKWQSLNTAKTDPLWLDISHVAAVVVSK